MNILVTGASKGIGFELVKFFAAKQGHIVFAVARNSGLLDKLTSECKSTESDSKIIGICVDITEESGREKTIEIINKNVVSLDVLINNAGLLINKPFEQITYNELKAVYDVNVFAPFSLIQDLLPLMNSSNKKHIINISSMGGFQGSSKFPGLSAYSSSKSALAGLTECLAEELKDKNIAVNCLALGSVQTDMLSAAFPGYKAPVNPTEIASFIGNFALTGHHFFNGKILPVSLSTP